MPRSSRPAIGFVEQPASDAGGARTRMHGERVELRVVRADSERVVGTVLQEARGQVTHGLAVRIGDEHQRLALREPLRVRRPPARPRRVIVDDERIERADLPVMVMQREPEAAQAVELLLGVRSSRIAIRASKPPWVGECISGNAKRSEHLGAAGRGRRASARDARQRRWRRHHA